MWSSTTGILQVTTGNYRGEPMRPDGVEEKQG